MLCQEGEARGGGGEGSCWEPDVLLLLLDFSSVVVGILAT